jgi:phytoene synthase
VPGGGAGGTAPGYPISPSLNDDRSDASPGEQVHAVVANAGTSFFWAMRLLPRPKREAMFAVYAYCRAVDDIADGDGSAAVKLAGLTAWRAEIDELYRGRPHHPISRALRLPVETYGLAKEDFLALLDGMEMDATNRMVAPSLAELELYCDRVAGAVGLLSVKIFGVSGPAARTVALTLGRALQLTNLLRDILEDAELGRLYLPRELLEAHGIETRDPVAVLGHPALAAVCGDLAEIAAERFVDARGALRDRPRRAVRPAMVMMHVYSRVLDRLMRRGWDRLDQPVRLHGAEKFWLALRYGIF